MNQPEFHPVPMPDMCAMRLTLDGLASATKGLIHIRRFIFEKDSIEGRIALAAEVVAALEGMMAPMESIDGKPCGEAADEIGSALGKWLTHPGWNWNWNRVANTYPSIVTS